MSSNRGWAPLLASLWRETMCGRRCSCIKKQIISERRLNTSAPNSSIKTFGCVGFTSCFECEAALGHSCIFPIDFCRLMKPSTFVSASRCPERQTTDLCFRCLSPSWNANPLDFQTLPPPATLWMQPFVCCQRRLGCKCRGGGRGWGWGGRGFPPA